MALTQDLSVRNQAGTDRVYVFQRSATDGIYRIDPTTTLTVPRTMVIRHSTTGKGTGASDRHLVSLQEVHMDGSNPVAATVNLTLAVPRSAVVTNQIIRDLVANLVHLVTDTTLETVLDMTRVDHILRGES